jgi:hypothetical protein
MDERTPAPGESLSSPPGGAAGFGSQQGYSSQGTWEAGGPSPHGKEDVRRFGSAARRRILSEADRRKSTIADRLEGFANSLENNRSSGPEGQFLDQAARMARNASSTIRNRSSEDLLGNVEQGFRDRPGAFLAGCLALGFIGGRLLRG